MKMNKIYRYFVEGETEKKVIEALKNKYLESGKITFIQTLKYRGLKI